MKTIQIFYEKWQWLECYDLIIINNNNKEIQLSIIAALNNIMNYFWIKKFKLSKLYIKMSFIKSIFKICTGHWPSG